MIEKFVPVYFTLRWVSFLELGGLLMVCVVGSGCSV